MISYFIAPLRKKSFLFGTTLPECLTLLVLPNPIILPDTLLSPDDKFLGFDELDFLLFVRRSKL